MTQGRSLVRLDWFPRRQLTVNDPVRLYGARLKYRDFSLPTQNLLHRRRVFYHFSFHFGH